MDKYTDLKSFTNHHNLSSYFNIPSGLQETYDVCVEDMPKQLELIKCSLCNRCIDMYMDIDKSVYKRIYCLHCISTNQALTASKSPSTQYDIAGNRSSKQDHSSVQNNHHNGSSKQNHSSKQSSSYSSPSSSVSIIPPSKAASKSKCHQKYNQSTDCCDMSTSHRYSHFLDVPLGYHASHHVCCDRGDKGNINKRSWSVANRRPWSLEQKDAIFSYFHQQIERRATIGKDDIIPLIELNKDLFSDRSWKEIKWVYYHHLKVLENRKLKHNPPLDPTSDELLSNENSILNH